MRLSFEWSHVPLRWFDVRRPEAQPSGSFLCLEASCVSTFQFCFVLPLSFLNVFQYPPQNFRILLYPSKTLLIFFKLIWGGRVSLSAKSGVDPQEGSNRVFPPLYTVTDYHHCFVAGFVFLLYVTSS